MSGACWGPRVRGERMHPLPQGCRGRGKQEEGLGAESNQRAGWGPHLRLGGCPWPYVLGACSHYISPRPWHW